MRIGSLVFATDQGLGYLAKSFVDAGLVTDVLRVTHKSRTNHGEWYPGSSVLLWRNPRADLETAKRFCAGMDAMLFFETPFFWELLPYCKEAGIKTFLMPMYECTPAKMPAEPDAYLCPSLLDLQYFRREGGPTAMHLPVPVEVPWRLRERAEVFVHNAGNGGLRNRNGTGELLDAMRHVKSPIKLILRTQRPLLWSVDDPRVEVRRGTCPAEQLWDEGDVLVFPDKFDGLSLPLQEARASGMLVMASSRFPATEYLDLEPLIPVARYERARVAARCLEFDEAIIRPEDIAARIDEWYGRDIREISLRGKAWAETMSWAALRPSWWAALDKFAAPPREGPS